MKEDQVRLVLALALSALVLIVWQHLFGPKPRALAALPGDGGAAPLVATAPRQAPFADGGAAVAAAPPTMAAPPPIVPAQPLPPEQTVTFDSKLRTFVFSSYGGTLKSAVLKGEQFRRRVNGKDVQVDLVQVRRGDDPVHPGPDPLPLSLVLGKGLPGISPDLPFQVQKETDGVTFTATVGDLVLTKRYHVPADGYDVALDVTLANRGAQPMSGELTTQVDGYAPPNPDEGGGFMGSRGPTEARVPLARVGDKTDRRSPEKDKPPQVDEGAVDFAGLDERYFLTAVYPIKDKSGTVTLDAPVEGLRLATVAFPVTVPATGQVTRTLGVFLGPKLQETLHEAGSSIPELKGAGPDLESAVDYGSVAVISTLLLKIMRFFHSLVPNWGLAILLLTVTVKGVLFPLTNKQMASMEAMRGLQPQIEELKKKFPDDKERQNTEMMKLYTQNKVNPLGGCIPTLIQMPVWWGLYRTLEYAFDLYRQPFIPGWINDLSAMDPTYLLPLAMGVSMFITQRMQPQMSTDATQQKMMLYAMPVFFTFIMKSLPSGLNLYIFCNNLLSIGQQSYLRRRYPGARAAMAKPQKK